jgi:hypothetical protein
LVLGAEIDKKVPNAKELWTTKIITKTNTIKRLKFGFKFAIQYEIDENIIGIMRKLGSLIVKINQLKKNEFYVTFNRFNYIYKYFW